MPAEDCWRSSMKKAVWLSFDLGVSGDYEGLYKWLANHHAIECGESLGFFHYESKAKNVDAMLEELTKDISENVTVSKKTRMYVVYRSDEQKAKGKFLFGNRRQPPWTGYGEEEQTVDEE